MALKLYNTLTREKEPFAPLDERHVRMYVCGPTVYDLAHVGNARPVVVFDVLFRLLRRLYGDGQVTYVRNITDVDDKIIAAAREKGEPIDALTRRTEQAFHEDMAALGALPPTVEPRATQHIPQMIAMIERLIASGHAYAAEGHVLFAVATKEDYGKLSNRSRDEMIAGARVEVAPYKKDPADFVLWKPSAPDQPGWDSPWGRGRPGWHIECSAMSAAHLGRSFDIHGGGLDLIFPHHENEIAQSECAHGGAPFARYWMHNGYLTVNGEKMSKSLGNFFTVRELLEKGHRGEAIRLVLLKTHYRQPLDFTEAALGQARSELDRFYRALNLMDAADAADGDEPPGEILAALSDDLNTPLAVSHMHEMVDRMFKAVDAGQESPVLRRDMVAAGRLLGLLQINPKTWLKGEADGHIDGLIARRNAARKARDFAEADRIRDELAEQGIVLEDKPGGKTEWRRAG